MKMILQLLYAANSSIDDHEDYNEAFFIIK